MPLPIPPYLLNISPQLRNYMRDHLNESNSNDNGITFIIDNEHQLRRMEEDNQDDDDDEDYEFFPMEDTYIDEDEEIEDSVDELEEERVSDDEIDNIFTDRIIRLLRSNSRSPPPPSYQPLTRANAALSLLSMLNNLTTSSNRLDSHRRRRQDDDSDDEMYKRWKLFQKNESIIDNKIRSILDKKIGVKLSETIFYNHYPRHELNDTPVQYRRYGLKKLDSILIQRELMLQPTPLTRSRKRRSDYDDQEEVVVTSQGNSFLQSGMTFISSYFQVHFASVLYKENLVSGVILSDSSNIFQFHGSIVDFVEEDLRYTTIHGSDEFKFQSSLDRNIILNDVNQFYQFKKKLDKWFKLPPFNQLQNKQLLEKIINCHNCLNQIMKNFILLKLTILIPGKDTLDIEDHLQMLLSIDRNTGELYMVSGELDYFQRCSSCNVVHNDHTNTTGNSIIDKILILNNDARLTPFKNLLINIELLKDIQKKDWSDIRDENVWQNDDYLSDKKFKKNNSNYLTKRFYQNKVKRIKYSHDELFVTKFQPRLGFHCLDVVLS